MEKIKYPKAVVKGSENETVAIDMSKVCSVTDKFSINDMCHRTAFEFEGKGIYLDKGFDWVIARDSADALVLLKLQKD